MTRAADARLEALRRERLGRQLLWMVVIRLVAFTSVLLPGYLASLSSGLALPPETFLRVMGLGYLLSLVYLVLLRALRHEPAIQAYCQYAGDLAWVSLLVVETGGASSPFSMLYLIVISVASVMLRQRAGILVATAAWLVYAALSLVLARGWLGSAGLTEPVATERLVFTLATHLFGFYGVALLTYVLTRDIRRTEARLARTAEDLAALESLHGDVIESLTGGMLIADLRERVHSINRKGRDILGLPTETIVGRPVNDLRLFSKEQWRQILERLELPEERIRAEAEYERADGTIVPIGYSAARVQDPEGEPRGVVINFQDLTEVQRLRQELSLKERMAAVGELAAGLAHEIGNPLAAITGSVQMLSRNAPPGGSEKKLLEITLEESRRLDRIIKNFLQFARPSERRAVRFDIAALMQEQVELLRNSEEVKPNHQVEANFQSTSVGVIGDRDQISQVFWNLARNALRAMPDGGTLEISGDLHPEGYSLRFRDTGVGMTAEQKNALFHPFKSFFDRGTGIGMAIVFRIVDEHRGRIQVHSSPGQGTTVEILLPMENTSKAVERPRPDAAGQTP